MAFWLNRLPGSVSEGIRTPAEMARFELKSALPDLSFEMEERAEMGDGYQIRQGEDGILRLTGGSAGLLYAAWRLITDALCGEKTSLPLSSAPRYALRAGPWLPPD